MEVVTAVQTHWFRFSRLVLRSIFVLFLSILLYVPLLFGKTLYFADNIALMIPVRLAVKELISQGAFPFWSHDITSGMPIHLEPAVAIWYPPNWLFMVGSPETLPYVLNAYFFLHLVFGGVGLWYLGKRIGRLSLFSCLIVVLTWIGSSYLVSVANNFALLSSASWIPWILYSLYRFASFPSRFTAGLMVVSIALGWYGNHPQPWILGIVASSGLFFVRVFTQFSVSTFLRKHVLLGIVAVVFTFLLVSINLIPMLEYTSRSTRTVLSTQDLIQGSLDPRLLVHWIMPNWYSNPDIGMVWGPEWNKIKQTHGFVGVGGLILFAYGSYFAFRPRKLSNMLNGDQNAVRYLSIVAILGVILSLGSYVPIIGQIYQHIPVIGALRNPSASLVLWAVLAPVIIGVGAEMLSRQKRPSSTILSWISSLFLIGSIVLYALKQGSVYWLPMVEQWLVRVEILPTGFLTLDRFSVILTNSMMSGAILLLSIGMFLVAIKLRGIRMILAVFFVILLELILGNKPIQLYANNDLYAQQSPQARWLQDNLHPGYRYLSGTDVLPYTGFTSYFHDVVTFPPFSTETRFTTEEQRDFRELKQRMNNLSSNWGAVYGLPTTYGYNTFVLQESARYWNQATRASDQTFDRPWQSSINYLDHPVLGTQFLQLHGVQYYLVDNLIYDNKTFQTQYPELVLVHQDLENTFSVFEDLQARRWISGEISELELHPNALSFTVEIPTQQDVVILYQTYDAGWRCQSSTTFCEVKNYHGYQQIELPHGTHHLELSYKPVAWNWMILIAGVSITSFLYWWLRLGTLQKR